jgi:hypothetical protein
MSNNFLGFAFEARAGCLAGTTPDFASILLINELKNLLCVGVDI